MDTRSRKYKFRNYNWIKGNILYTFQPHLLNSAWNWIFLQKKPSLDHDRANKMGAKLIHIVGDT